MKSMQQRQASHPRQGVWSSACAALLALSLPISTSVRAAEGDIDLPLYDLPATAHAAARAGDATSTSPAGEKSTRRGSVDVSRSTPSFSLVELPPEASMPGSGYKRPHHALGYRWQAAESWLRDHGFDAQTCLMPMVRMHTKLAPGATSSTLWVYGRCTFR